MPKLIDYEVTLYPAHKEGGFIVTNFEMLEDYPERSITAAGMDDLVTQVEAFANEHAKGCRASVKCIAPRKPRGFKDATSDLHYNLEEKPRGSAWAS